MKKIKGINSQNKLMLTGLIMSSVLIIIVAYFAISITQKKIFDSYYNFGLMMCKTLAIQPVTNDNTINSYELIKQNAENIARNHPDISSIIFYDNKGKTTFSTIKNKNIINPKEDLNFNAPLILEQNGKIITTGAIRLTLNSQTLNDVKKTTKNSMIIIFGVAWFMSVFAVMINTILLTRQIGFLADGVKRISSGQFGYKVNTKDLWGDIKLLFDAFNDMSMRLHKYEESNIDKLTYERNKLEAVLMSIANGVVVCDKFDKVILFNNSALKNLEVEADNLMDSKISEYYDGERHNCFKEEIDKFKNTPLEEIENNQPEFQVTIDEKTFKTVISPMFNLNNEYMGYILVLHDMTKEAEIDKLKNNFISNVSHELRTPVTVLRSYIETLHSYGDDFNLETQKEFIGILNQEITRLNNMVNDILDFSRLESPNIKLEKTFCDLGSIAEVVVSSLSIIAKEKNISFSMIFEPEVPKIYINADNIERAIKNLISNAIKYSHKNGKIKVRIELDKTGKNIIFAVEDNGIGIPQEHLPKVFDRFYRVENATHTIKGTGIGLHLVKVSIEKHHNGEVFVESKEGEGSTFGFKLPILAPIQTNDNTKTTSPVVHATAIQHSEDGWEINLEKK